MNVKIKEITTLDTLVLPSVTSTDNERLTHFFQTAQAIDNTSIPKNLYYKEVFSRFLGIEEIQPALRALEEDISSLANSFIYLPLKEDGGLDFTMPDAILRMSLDQAYFVPGFSFILSDKQVLAMNRYQDLSAYDLDLKRSETTLSEEQRLKSSIENDIRLAEKQLSSMVFETKSTDLRVRTGEEERFKIKKAKKEEYIGNLIAKLGKATKRINNLTSQSSEENVTKEVRSILSNLPINTALDQKLFSLRPYTVFELYYAFSVKAEPAKKEPLRNRSYFFPTFALATLATMGGFFATALYDRNASNAVFERRERIASMNNQELRNYVESLKSDVLSKLNNSELVPDLFNVDIHFVVKGATEPNGTPTAAFLHMVPIETKEYGIVHYKGLGTKDGNLYFKTKKGSYIWTNYDKNVGSFALERPQPKNGSNFYFFTMPKEGSEGVEVSISSNATYLLFTEKFQSVIKEKFSQVNIYQDGISYKLDSPIPIDLEKALLPERPYHITFVGTPLDYSGTNLTVELNYSVNSDLRRLLLTSFYPYTGEPCDKTGSVEKVLRRKPKL